jgi:hypothetical protein
MIPASPKRKRGPHLPLDTQRPPHHFLFDDGIDDVESPRTKVSKTFDTLDLDGENDSPLTATAKPQQDVELSTHSDHGQDHVQGLPESNFLSGQACEHIANNLSKTFQEDDASSAIASCISSRSKSPPLDGEISDKFWHDSEITGHDPTDPNDDGYGINGIGFRPTPAIAWSRSQRRKQQLTDLKNREAREARQQRSERRKRFISESDDYSAAMDASPRKSARVRFENG